MKEEYFLVATNGEGKRFGWQLELNGCDVWVQKLDGKRVAELEYELAAKIEWQPT